MTKGYQEFGDVVQVKEFQVCDTCKNPAQCTQLKQCAGSAVPVTDVPKEDVQS